MRSRLQGYDVTESFAEDSPGRKAQRLIGTFGKPVLGVEAWDLGLRAFESLHWPGGDDVNNAVVSRCIADAAPVIDDIIGDLRRSGKIEFVSAKTSMPFAEDDWANAGFAWKVRVVWRAMLASPGARHNDVLNDFGGFVVLAALVSLDDAVISEFLDDTETLAACILDAAWFLDQIDAGDRIEAAAAIELRSLDSRRASDRARLRHAVDPKRAARDFVHECWRVWRAKPEQYASAAEFARSMLDKQPHALKSEVVIARWVRQWDREAH